MATRIAAARIPTPRQPGISLGGAVGVVGTIASPRRSHLCHQLIEHRVGAPASDRLDRRLPHVPSVYEALAQQRSDELEIEATVLLQGAQLLEIVEFSVQHVGTF